MEKNQTNQELPHGSGMIYSMIGWLANNRTTVYLFTFIFFLTGLFIYNNLPKEQFPEVKMPQIYVQTIYFGTTPADIENVINKPIEKQLKTVSGVKRIKSNALQDVSVILIEFNPTVDVADALQRVRDAIDKAKRDLPQKLDSGPTAQDVNFSEFPVMNINLAGNFSLEHLKDYAEQLQDDIEALPEITRVDIVGALKREIQINLDLYRMQASGLSFYDVQTAIQGENINMSGGDLSVDNVRRSIRVKGEFKDMEQIKNLLVRSSAGATVRLGDVAEVTDSHEERQDFARLEGKSVVTLNVIKRAGANLISASDKIEKLLENAKVNKFPQGLEIKITADQSERTRESISDLVNTVILGFIFVVIVLMFFMGVRDAIFVGLSVPLSALLAFVPLYFSGFTLNTMVLFAFLLGLGIVVDDAIVVIENAHRLFNQHRKLSIVEAVKLAASEVFIPVLSGTLTTIAPFFPLLFWPGIVGEFMKYLPLTLIYTLFASLIVAYIMNPVFAMSFMSRHDEGKHDVTTPTFETIKKPLIILGIIAVVSYLINIGLGNFTIFIALLYIFNHYILTPKLIIPFQEGALVRFKNAYRKLISWVIVGKRPVWSVVAMFGLLIATFVLVGIVKPKVIFFPSGEPDYIYVYNVMPVGTDARLTDSVTKIIEQKVFAVIKRNKAENAINSVISNVGKNAGDPMNPDRSATPNKSKVTVAFVKGTKRGGISTQDILDQMRAEIKGIPGSEISVQRENNGPPTGKPIQVEIAGDDFSVLIDLQKKVFAAINKSGIKGIEELKSDLITNKPEIVVDIDKGKAQREGISSQQVAFAIRTALFGAEISKFRDDKDEYPIQLRLKADNRNQVEKLLSLNITYRDMAMGGVLRQVPLNSIANISYSTTYSQINRKNQQRVITLGSEVLNGYNANEIVQQIQSQVFPQIEVPNGYTLKMGGEQEEQNETAAFLGGALLAAILLIYLILATQFNSLVKPIIIFVTILLSFIGVFLGFMLFNMTFSILMSGVGIIALAGIVVKNGILLIEFTDELRSRGLPLREAIIEGGATRLTPVLLTASAAILGLVPLAVGLGLDFVTMFTELNPHIHTGADSSVFWNILAWTIIFGLSFSTVLTLVIVPCLYYINERVREKYFRKNAVA
jgi:multidrug efflux pump